MGIVIRLPRRHARASTSASKKSSAVTAPLVITEIFSATSRDGQPPSSQSCVILPGDTPISRAKSPRLMPRNFKYSANFMETTFSPTKNSAQVKFSVPLDGLESAQSRKFIMPKAKKEQQVQTRFKEPPFRPTFIRQWRKYRKLTIEKLADRIGMSIGNLSNIETGKTGYGQETLEALAAALQCAPADLLMRNPMDPEAIWSLWESAKPAQRKQIIGIIKGLLDSEAA